MVNSAGHHLAQYQEGLLDEDHAIAAAWNILCAVDYEERMEIGLLPLNLYEGLGSLFYRNRTKDIAESEYTSIHHYLKNLLNKELGDK